MEYENMRVPELKALARDRGLRNYSRMRRAELVALLQNNPPPAPQVSTWEPTDVRFRPDRPRQPPHKTGWGATAGRGASVSTSGPTQQNGYI